jgi:hypothetical protein
MTYIDDRGYRRVGDKKEHIIIAEKALGHKLPPGAVVHHWVGKSNENSNLAIFPNQAYHLLIHQRMAAKKACGNPNWRKCVYCKKYDDPENMRPNISNNTMYHKKCATDYLRDGTYVFSRPRRKASR